MELVIKGAAFRRLLILVEFVIFLLLTVFIAKTYVAGILAAKLTVNDLNLAIRLDPKNADYYLALGRIYEYVIPNVDPEKAIQEFRRAAQLNPFDPQVWLNWGAALEFQGSTTEAEKCLRRADQLAPHLPDVQWPIGNFFLLHGNTREAFEHLKVVLAGTRQYDRTLFDIAWKSSDNPDAILQDLIPHKLGAEYSYLYFLVSKQHWSETYAVWDRIKRSPENSQALGAAGYIDSLIGAHQPEKAYQIWTDLHSLGLVKSLLPDPTKNLIANGDFEDDLLPMGFAWRIAPVENVYAGLDSLTFHSPSHSMMVQFSGKQNLDYRHVFQYIIVEPKQSYRLRGFIKTENITTDSGPRLEVRDAYDSRVLDQMTEDLTGTTDGWTSLLLDFTTGPKTKLVIVSLTRLPSRKLDNLIRGKVWLDDVKLTSLAKN